MGVALAVSSCHPCYFQLVKAVTSLSGFRKDILTPPFRNVKEFTAITLEVPQELSVADKNILNFDLGAGYMLINKIIELYT